MTPAQTYRARRLADAGYLRAGMWTTHGSVLLSDAVLDGGVWRCRIIDPGDPGHVWTRIDPDETIDMEHPATIGVVEHLARMAWGGHRLEVASAHLGWACFVTPHLETSASRTTALMPCRGSAWAEALLAAPGVSS